MHQHNQSTIIRTISPVPRVQRASRSPENWAPENWAPENWAPEVRALAVRGRKGLGPWALVALLAGSATAELQPAGVQELGTPTGGASHFTRSTAFGPGSGGVALGSPPRLLVSTTSDLDPVNGLPAISDAGLPMVAGVDPPTAHFVETHWQAVAGFVPTDVDGLARVPGSTPGADGSLAFSLLSNEAGVKDGDVVVLDGSGGLTALVTEEVLLSGLGRDDADIDLDGIAFDTSGLLLFTLQSDLDASALGAIQDGDVLRLEANGSVTLFMTEDDVQAQFTVATGSTAAIGDVNGLEWVLGELWVTTQGPSTWDGAVIGVGSAPIVLVDETLAGLGGAELDAVAFVRPGDEIPSLSLDVQAATEGDVIRAELVGQPNSTHLILFAGGTGVLPVPNVAGWGSIYLDPTDAWLGTVLANPLWNFVFLDGNGRLTIDYVLPTTAFWGPGFGAEEGWSFQMLDLTSLELSAPVRLLRQ